MELNHDALVRRRSSVPTPVRAAVQARPLGDWLDHDPDNERLRRRAELQHRVGAPLMRPLRVAVVSLKGGVGKTTVSAGLGLTLAEHRGDRIAVLDAAPDPGTLASRLMGAAAGAREHLATRDRVETLGELVSVCGLAGRLSVVGSTDTPGLDEFGAAHYRQVDAHLSRFFDIVVTDCGPGMRHSAVRAAVVAADVLLVAGAFAVDDASRAAATLDWLDAHGLSDRAREALVVLTADRPTPQVPTDRVREHFARRARGVLEIPHDPHLRSGGPIDYDQLRDSTRDRFLELAALVVEGVPGRADTTISGATIEAAG